MTPEINLVDQTLKNYRNKTELSIQVSMSGFSFCIFSTENALIRAFRYYKFTNTALQEDIMNSVDDILCKDELLKLPHTKTRVIFTGRKSTMVPYGFFNNKQLKQLFEFNHPLEDLEEIHYNNIKFSESYLVFALHSYFAGMLSEKFKEIKFFNQATPLLFYANQLTGKDKGNAIIINLNKDFFDIIVLQDNALKFINTFLYVNSVDLLYFILYVCKQLKIDTKKIDFHLTGEESNKTSLTTDLSKYIPRLSKIDSFQGVQLSDNLIKIDASRHFTLLHLAKCE